MVYYIYIFHKLVLLLCSASYSYELHKILDEFEKYMDYCKLGEARFSTITFIIMNLRLGLEFIRFGVNIILDFHFFLIYLHLHPNYLLIMKNVRKRDFKFINRWSIFSTFRAFAIYQSNIMTVSTHTFTELFLYWSKGMRRHNSVSFRSNKWIPPKNY